MLPFRNIPSQRASSSFAARMNCDYEDIVVMDVKIVVTAKWGIEDGERHCIMSMLDQSPRLFLVYTDQINP